MAADARTDPRGMSPPDPEPVLLVERPKAGLAVVTLNRPAAMNALSMPLRRLIIDAFRDLAADGVRVVVLTGAGRAFCAGLDLREMAANTGSLTSATAHSPVAAVERFDGVVIGAINGPAVTGGFELALACDVMIASEEARFADTHARVGALPGWGLSQKLSRSIGPYRAKLVSLTGTYVGATQARDWGLVADVVPRDRLLGAALALADQLLAAPADMLRKYVRLIDEGYAIGLADARAMEAERAEAHNGKVGPTEIADRRAAVQAHGSTAIGTKP